MGYGTGPYGLGAWGSAFSSISVSVDSAWAISTHSVRVTLTDEPQAIDQFDLGDATNPGTWQIVDLTTGRQLTVILATMHDTTSVDVVTLEPLGDHLETHEVTSIGLIASGGLPSIAPLSAQFAGVVLSTDPVDNTKLVDHRDRDIANPPFDISRVEGAGGTYVFSEDGDIANEVGRPLQRKLIIRRLTTPRGSFPWLPQYGIGLREKEPVPSGGDVLALAREVEDQIKQEPDIGNVRARITADRRGVLIVQVSYSDAEGITANMRFGNANGRLVEM